MKKRLCNKLLFMAKVSENVQSDNVKKYVY